jgi:NADPH:quinone reductase-like Zn-dependent oxidoreductase
MYTAWGALMLAGRLRERPRGSIVLIHGATSSVGIWGLLVAKDAGSVVIATTRNPEKVQRLKDAGADHVILEQDMEAEVPNLYPDGVDIVIELVGPDRVMDSVKFCARYGTAVLVGPLNKHWSAGLFEPFSIPPTRNVSFFTMTNSGLGSEDADVDHKTINKLLEDVIRKVERATYPQDAFLDKTFKLAEIGEAHEYMENNKAVGKVVVTVP